MTGKDRIIQAIDRAWQKKEQFEALQVRLEDILLKDRVAPLREIASPHLRREDIAAALKRYHQQIATAGPDTWISEILTVALELVDWESLAIQVWER